MGRIDWDSLDKKSEVRTARKVCAKCGQKSWVKPRERRCKRRLFGKNGYWCYGTLSPVPRKKASAVTVPDDEAYVALWRRNTEARMRRAANRLATWQRVLDDVTRRQKRAEARMEKWQKGLARLEQRVSMTDDEILAKRDRIKVAQRVQRVRRRLVGKGRKAGLLNLETVLPVGY